MGSAGKENPVPSLTIKQIDDRLLRRLREQARKRNLSLNAYVRELLARSVGLEPGVETFTDLSDLAGCWSEEEAQEFRINTEPFNKIDEDLWR